MLRFAFGKGQRYWSTARLAVYIDKNKSAVYKGGEAARTVTCLDRQFYMQ